MPVYYICTSQVGYNRKGFWISTELGNGVCTYAYGFLAKKLMPHAWSSLIMWENHILLSELRPCAFYFFFDLHGPISRISSPNKKRKEKTYYVDEITLWGFKSFHMAWRSKCTLSYLLMCHENIFLFRHHTRTYSNGRRLLQGYAMIYFVKDKRHPL